MHREKDTFGGWATSSFCTRAEHRRPRQSTLRLVNLGPSTSTLPSSRAHLLPMAVVLD